MGDIKVKLKAKTAYFDFENGNNNLINNEMYAIAGFGYPYFSGASRVNGTYTYTKPNKTKNTVNKFSNGSWGCELMGNSVYLRNIIAPTSRKYLKVTFDLCPTYTTAIGDKASSIVLCGIYWSINNNKTGYENVFAGTDFTYASYCRSTLCSGKNYDLGKYTIHDWNNIIVKISNTTYKLYVGSNLIHTVNFPDKATKKNSGNNNLYYFSDNYKFGFNVPDNYNPWDHDNDMTYLSILFSIPHNGNNGTKVFIDNVNAYWSDNENDTIVVRTNIISTYVTGLTITDNTSYYKAFEFN